MPGILEENRLAGDCEAQLLGPEELLEVAPELSRKALGAVMCPHEGGCCVYWLRTLYLIRFVLLLASLYGIHLLAVVEPWLVPVGFAISARALGVEILTGRKVVSLHHLFTRPLAYGGCDTAPDGAGGWKVVTQKTRGPEASSTGRSEAGSLLVPGPQRESRGAEGDSSEVLSARVIVNCAGKPYLHFVFALCVVRAMACRCHGFLMGSAISLCAHQRFIRGRNREDEITIPIFFLDRDSST